MVTRDDVLKWAKAHSYPAIQFRGIEAVKFYPVKGLPPVTQPLKYAIGIEGSRGNKMLWETAISLASSDMINGLLKYLDSIEKAS